MQRFGYTQNRIPLISAKVYHLGVMFFNSEVAFSYKKNHQNRKL